MVLTRNEFQEEWVVLMYRMLCSYYGGEILYSQLNSYSRYTKQYLHYLYMFSTKWLNPSGEDLEIAIEYLNYYKGGDTCDVS
jgi:hypothetical protein